MPLFTSPGWHWMSQPQQRLCAKTTLPNILRELGHLLRYRSQLPGQNLENTKATVVASRLRSIGLKNVSATTTKDPAVTRDTMSWSSGRFRDEHKETFLPITRRCLHTYHRCPRVGLKFIQQYYFPLYWKRILTAINPTSIFHNNPKPVKNFWHTVGTAS